MEEVSVSKSEKEPRKFRYVRSHHPGIFRIQEWDQEKGEYSERKEGSLWYAYKKRGKIQKTKQFFSFRDAQRWLESPGALTEVPEETSLTFREVMARFFEWKASRVKASTLQTYRNYVEHLSLFNDLLVREITPAVVDSWLRKVKEPAYLATQHKTRLSFEHEVEVLRQILSYCAEYLDDAYRVPVKKRHREDSIIEKARYREAKTRNRLKYIPRSECEKFLQELCIAAENESKEWPYYLVGLLQLRAGLRVGEAAALDWRDLNFQSGNLEIAKTVQWSRKKGVQTRISPTTKSGKPRIVRATSDLLSELRKWRENCGRSAGLICSLDGFRPVNYRNIQCRFNRIFRRLGIPFYSTHILRHSLATDFQLRTKNPLALKEILGHADLRQTEVYAKITEAITQEAMQSYDESLQEVGKLLKIGGPAR
jgi:integrase